MRRAELEKIQAVALTEAKARAEKMAGATVQIMGKAGEEGKLFGSIGTADIAEAMTQAGFPLERAEIDCRAVRSSRSATLRSRSACMPRSISRSSFR